MDVAWEARPFGAFPCAAANGWIVIARDDVPSEIGMRPQLLKRRAKVAVGDAGAVEYVASNQDVTRAALACGCREAVDSHEPGTAQYRRLLGREATEGFADMPVTRVEKRKGHGPPWAG